jgi:membrane protein implicated in regulation of membrane protease activity
LIHDVTGCAQEGRGVSWITEHPGLAWLALALALAAFEVVSIDFVFLMFVVGALAAGAAAGLGAPFVVQVIIGVVVSLLMLGVVRPVIVRRVHGGPPTLTGAAALVGTTAQVVEAVTEHGGRVKIGGEVWSARSASEGVAPATAIMPGEPVRVVSIDGATAVVTTVPPYPDTPSAGALS